MPKINDKRILQGKRNRNKAIRRYFARYFNAGLRYEIIIEKLILKHGLSESSINQILKKYGGYSNESVKNKK